MIRPAARRTAKLAAATLTLGLFAGLGVQAPASAATPDASATGGRVVISQVYGGGGNIGGVLAHDFVELFNRTSEPVDVGGWSVQYAAATGTTAFGATIATRTAIPNDTVIPAGGTLLIRGANGDQLGQPALPTPDVTSASPIQLHESSGKVALVKQVTSLGCNTAATCSPGQLALIEDLVGYGSANWAEGAPVAALNPRTAAVRAGAGCVDTGRNSLDLALAVPAPRNSASPAAPCVVATPAGAPVPQTVAEPAPAPVEREAGEVTLETVEVLSGQVEKVGDELTVAATPAEIEQLVAEIIITSEIVDEAAQLAEPQISATELAAPVPALVEAPKTGPHPACNGLVIAQGKATGKAATTVNALFENFRCAAGNPQAHGR